MTLSESDDMRESPGKDLRVDNALRILQERASRGHVSATPPDLRLLLPTPSTPTALVLRILRSYYPIKITRFSRTQLCVNIKQERSGLRLLSKILSIIRLISVVTRGFSLENV